MEKTPETGVNWKTSEVLLHLLSSTESDITCWLHKGSELRYIMTSCLIQVMSSTDVEQTMSVFALFDNKLNQAARSDTIEKMVLILKELPTWKAFDPHAAFIIWKLQKAVRKYSFPPMKERVLMPAEGKSWVKPISEIKSGEAVCKQRLLKRLEKVSEYDLWTDDESGNESEEDEEMLNENEDRRSDNDADDGVT